MTINITSCKVNKIKNRYRSMGTSILKSRASFWHSGIYFNSGMKDLLTFFLSSHWFILNWSTYYYYKSSHLNNICAPLSSLDSSLFFRNLRSSPQYSTSWLSDDDELWEGREEDSFEFYETRRMSEWQDMQHPHQGRSSPKHCRPLSTLTPMRKQ